MAFQLQYFTHEEDVLKKSMTTALILAIFVGVLSYGTSADADEKQPSSDQQEGEEQAEGFEKTEFA